MLNNSDIEKYRSIKAPAELKNRVLEQAAAARPKRKILNIRTMSAIAACFLVLLVCIPFLNTNKAPVTISSLRLVSRYSFPRDVGSIVLVIESEGKIDISTDEDCFYYVVDETQKTDTLKVLKGVNNRIEIGWYISDAPSYLKVNGSTYELTYSLYNDELTCKKIK